MNNYTEIKLDEADLQAINEKKRLTHEEVFGKLRKSASDKNKEKAK